MNWTICWAQVASPTQAGTASLFDWAKVAELSLAALIAILGWFICHRFEVARDLTSKRRELRVHYLIDAYQRIEAIASRSPQESDKYKDAFESGIADILLFGTANQVKLAQQLAEGIAAPSGQRDETLSSGPLLLSLRDDLRKELDFEPLTTDPFHLRIRANSAARSRSR
jgi:hypothetical protein